jgi:hypothetical protein
MTGPNQNDAEQVPDATQASAVLADETDSSFDEQLDWLIDEAIKDSFPASDPPCWTLGREPPAEADPVQQIKKDDEGSTETD